MKRQFILFVLLIICCFFSACSTNDTGISEVEQIYIDAYEGQNDFSKSVKQIVENLGVNGYISIDSENKVNMTNADQMKQFINAHKSGEQAQIHVLQVLYSGGLNYIEINTDKGRAGVSQIYYLFQDNRLSEHSRNEFEADYFEYTDEGYLLIEGHWDSFQNYVLSLSDEEAHIALRVEPLDEKCRELCAKYITPISYGLNNVFITEWNEDNYSELDFNDIFDKFYAETYAKIFPYTMNEDYSVTNEYEISSEEFETVVFRHFKVTSEDLHMLLNYDDNSDVYIYRPRGFEEHDYAEVPYPEVVAYEENNDGSMTLTVNAVYPTDNSSKLFSHRVTVSDLGDSIYYLSNEIIGDEKPDCWWHSERIAADESYIDEEKKKIEADSLMTATQIWDLYENVTIDESQTSGGSGIVNFTKEQRIAVRDALGSLGVIAVTNDANTQNGELMESFYDDYKNGKPCTVAICNVCEDGMIGFMTFMYRDKELKSYYVGIKPGNSGEPIMSDNNMQDIASINYTEKGYFLYEYKNPMIHESPYGYFRISPMSDECRSLTDKYLKNLEFQKYSLMLCDWDENTVYEQLMPGMFEDFYFIKYHEGYRESLDAIRGELFEEIMTTFLPVTVDDLRTAFEYDENTGTYRQDTVYNSPYPPFLEVMDYKYNSDGTITLYADGVWPDYNSDYAFTSIITVMPFDDGTFRILSNDVTEQELKLPL